jgi:DNA polymerase-3 subunit theta
MSHNLGNLSKEEKDRINADKAAAAVVYAERHGTEGFNELKTEHEQPPALREYFRERLEYYRSK